MSDPLLIVEDSFGDIAIESASASAHSVRVESVGARSGAEFAASARHADGVVVRYLQLSDADLQDVNWKVIGRYGIGVDNVDVDAASRRGIAVVNVPDYCIEEVAQHAVAMIYAGLRRLHLAHQLATTGRWSEWQALGSIGRMSNSTLGLVGLGRIGSAVARLLKPAFGTVIAFDPAVSTKPDDIELVSLDEVLGRSDAVSLHCPLTEATRAMLSDSTLSQMRLGSVLVNVSRGELIDIAALQRALPAGRPGIALLDVLPTEPPEAGSSLFHQEGLVLSPHVAWLSDESIVELRSKVAERCAGFLVGITPPSIVNADALKEGS